MVGADPGHRGLPTLRVNGADLAFEEQGSGSPVILVHGAISDLRSWRALVPLLCARHRVISFSRRYAWPNAPIPDDTGDPWTTHADDLGALIEALGVAPAHLVGNSSGAYVALLTGRARPALVRSLVLEEPPLLPLFLGKMPPSPAGLATLLFTRPRAAAAVLRFAATAMGPAIAAFRKGHDARGLERFARGVRGAEDFAAITPARRAQMDVNTPALKAGLLRAGMPPFSATDARAISRPTLILGSERITDFQRAVNQRLAALVPGAELATVAGASHLMHEDAPDATARAILGFLARHDGA